MTGAHWYGWLFPDWLSRHISWNVEVNLQTFSRFEEHQSRFFPGEGEDAEAETLSENLSQSISRHRESVHQRWTWNTISSRHGVAESQSSYSSIQLSLCYLTLVRPELPV